MENSIQSLPDELLWIIASYLDSNNWITFFQAMTNTSKARKLTQALGKNLVRQIILKREPSYSDTEYNLRKEELLSKGLVTTTKEAAFQATYEESSRARRENKEQIHRVMQFIAGTKMDPIDHNSILNLLVKKVIRVFSSLPRPDTREMRCRECEKVFQSTFWSREKVRFQILPEELDNEEGNHPIITATVDPEGYFLALRILKPRRIGCKVKVRTKHNKIFYRQGRDWGEFYAQKCKGCVKSYLPGQAPWDF